MSSFGGEWTKQKLEILGKYLDAYTTALKKQPFKLFYIDAFAGSGTVELGEKDKGVSEFIEGSASIAIQVDDKPFDQLVFIEQDETRCKDLLELKGAHQSRTIEVKKGEANGYLQELCAGWKETHRGYRGVLFLDPFATQVEWATVKAVANTESLDVWILFPVSAIARMLPRSQKPEDVSETWACRLNCVFGDDSWKRLYSFPEQTQLFGERAQERSPGVKGIVQIYKENLRKIVDRRLLDKTTSLTNSKNSPLFELVFFAGNHAGTPIAHSIAGHLLGNI